MNTRRKFIKALAAVGMLTAFRLDAAAKKPTEKLVRFTKDVRKRTKSISVAKGRWKLIVGHHSAIKFGNAKKYDKAHRDRGMENGLAYHFVIGNGTDSGDGEIEVGSRWLRQIKGGHVRSDKINQVAIGICLVGNFEETKPTAKQLIAFRELVDYLRADVVGKKIRFAVHREVDPGHTVCPGRNFPIKQMHRLYGQYKLLV